MDKKEVTFKTTVCVDDAIGVEARYSDFDGGIEKWRESFYTIWRWQMTWGFAHRIEVHEYRGGDLAVRMVIIPAYKKNVEWMMDELGYKKVRYDDQKIGVMSGYDVPDGISLDDLMMD